MLKVILPIVCASVTRQKTFDKALSVSCKEGHKEVAEFLVTAGANVNAVVWAVPKLELTDEDFADELTNVEEHLVGMKPRGRRSPSSLELTQEDPIIEPRTALQACLQEIPASHRDDCHDLDDPRLSEVFRDNKQDLVARQESVIFMLLDNEADVNRYPADGSGCQMPPLCSAVLHCSEEVVKTMISKGADVNLTLHDGRTPLMLAAWREIEALSIVRALLAAGAEIPFEIADEGARSPVLQAALNIFGPDPLEEPSGWFLWGRDGTFSGRFFESRSLEEVMTAGPGSVVKLLLQKVPSLHAKDQRFSLLMQMAAAWGDAEFVRLMIDRQVNVNAYGHTYGTALQAAARFGHLQCVYELLKAGASVNVVKGASGTALHAAVEGGVVDIVRAIIEHKANVNLCLPSPRSNYARDELYQPAILLAVQCKQLQMVQLLLQAGATIPQDLPVLHSAVDGGDVHMLKELLDVGVDLHSRIQGKLPILIHAAGAGHVDMVVLLVSRGADVTADGSSCERSSMPDTNASALHKASNAGHLEIVKILLHSGADVEKRSECGLTPLGLAARAGHLEVVNALLEAGTKMTDFHHVVSNSLTEACRGAGHEGTVELLLKRLTGSPNFITMCKEASSAAQDSGKLGAYMLVARQLPPELDVLQVACRCGHKDTVEWALAQGMDVNGEFKDGGRPLHVAAYHGLASTVSLLLEKGADVTRVSSKFGYPLAATLEGRLARTVSSWQQSQGEDLRRLLPEQVETTRDSGKFINRQELRAQNCRTHGDAIIHLLLQRGARVDTEPGSFGTPLHLAAYFGDVELVQLFLDKGAALNASGGFAGSALIAALHGDQIDMMQFLLQRGIDANLASSKLGTALHYACKHKDSQTIQMLLDAGVDVNADNCDEESPFTTILSRRSSFRNEVGKLVELFLNQGNRLQIRMKDLKIAATRPSDDIVDGTFSRLLDHDKSMTVTKELIAEVEASDETTSSRSLEMLLARATGYKVTPGLLRAVRGSRSLTLLLQHQPRCAATPDLFEIYAKIRPGGYDMIFTLLEHDADLLPTEDSVLAFLQADRSEACVHGDSHPGTLDVLGRLLDRNSAVQVTQAMLSAARDTEELAVLCDRAPSLQVSQELLESVVARKSRSGRNFEWLDTLDEDW